MSLFLAIIAFLIFLALNIHIKRTPEQQFSFRLKVVVGLSILPCLLNSWSFLVITQVIISFVLIGIVKWTITENKHVLWVVGILASAAVFGVMTRGGIRELKIAFDICKQFPMESMEDRVPEPKSTDDNILLVANQSGMMLQLEDANASKMFNLRAMILGRYHDEKLLVFSQSSGFGLERGFFRRDSSILHELERKSPNLKWRQGRPLDQSMGVPDPEVKARASFEELHRNEVTDFSNPIQFGYVKDRLHVAGFQSHQFENDPAKAEDWRVERLDLLGLLLHREPVVYVTDKLPQMEELRGATTRALDSFEKAGLARLNAGENLYMVETHDGMRMLGAVRNMKQCVTCHGGRRGDLLGAFSYVLRK